MTAQEPGARPDDTEPVEAADHAEQADPGALRTSDPGVLKALAHPVRVELLAALDQAREATASELADRLGQTVANASFHLRALEKAGLVTRAPQRGREKPWRPAHHNRQLRPDPAVPESIQTSGALAALYVQREAARLTRFLSSGFVDADAGWLDTVTVTTGAFWATQDELRALAEQIAEILEPFAGRDADPGVRPEGAVHARFLGALNPELDYVDPPVPSDEP